MLAGITLVLYGMIGLLGAKIWVENRVNFADPVNLVPVAAGLILAIGFGTSGFFQITDDFSLGGIALGTIVIIAGYHVARAIEPRELAHARMAVDDTAPEVGAPRDDRPHGPRA